MVKLIWFVGLVLWGCGSHEAPSGLGLSVRFPAALARSQGRRARFEQRVLYMQVRLTTRAGFAKSFRVAVQDWQNLRLPAVAFPKDPQDRLWVSVQVWDRTSAGEARVFPALVGLGRISSQELASHGESTVVVPLSLRLPISEYDE